MITEKQTLHDETSQRVARSALSEHRTLRALHIYLGDSCVWLYTEDNVENLQWLEI